MPWCVSRQCRLQGPASLWVRTWTLPSAVMVWAMLRGAMLWLPKPGARYHVAFAEVTPPVRASVSVGVGMADAVRRNGMGTDARRCVGWPKPGARPHVQLAEADAVREGQCHRERRRSRCRLP
jgi:hypothetical protein